MKNTNESGRSMVEMLGVLAIIGVLSIGGIAGYTMAMNKYQANEIVNTIVQGAVVCRTQSTTGDIASKVDLDTTNGLLSALTCTNTNEGTVGWSWATNLNADVKTAVCKALSIASGNACPGTLEYTPTS